MPITTEFIPDAPNLAGAYQLGMQIRNDRARLQMQEQQLQQAAMEHARQAQHQAQVEARLQQGAQEAMKIAEENRILKQAQAERETGFRKAFQSSLKSQPDTFDGGMRLEQTADAANETGRAPDLRSRQVMNAYVDALGSDAASVTDIEQGIRMIGQQQLGEDRLLSQQKISEDKLTAQAVENAKIQERFQERIALSEATQKRLANGYAAAQVEKDANEKDRMGFLEDIDNKVPVAEAMKNNPRWSKDKYLLKRYGDKLSAIDKLREDANGKKTGGTNAPTVLRFDKAGKPIK